MAIINIKWASIAVGAGAALLGTKLLPALGGALKSTTKTLIKTSLLTYEGGKGLVNRTTRSIENIASEARAELKESSAKKPAAKKVAAKSARPKKTAPRQTAAQKAAHEGAAG